MLYSQIQMINVTGVQFKHYQADRWPSLSVWWIVRSCLHFTSLILLMVLALMHLIDYWLITISGIIIITCNLWCTAKDPSGSDGVSSCMHSPVILCDALFSLRLLSAWMLWAMVLPTGSWCVLFHSRWKSLPSLWKDVFSFVVTEVAEVVVVQSLFKVSCLGDSVVWFSVTLTGNPFVVVEGVTVVFCSWQCLQWGQKVSPLTCNLDPQQRLFLGAFLWVLMVLVAAVMDVGKSCWSAGLCVKGGVLCVVDVVCGCEFVVTCDGTWVFCVEKADRPFLVPFFFPALFLFDINMLLLKAFGRPAFIEEVVVSALWDGGTEDSLWRLLHPFPFDLRR